MKINGRNTASFFTRFRMKLEPTLHAGKAQVSPEGEFFIGGSDEQGLPHGMPQGLPHGMPHWLPNLQARELTTEK
jgi:hypothetical protein